MSQKNSPRGKLYLLPCPIGDTITQITPDAIKRTLSLRYFIVERSRTLRRYLKQLDPQLDIDRLRIMEMDKHQQNIDKEYLAPCLQAHDVGLLSEAGLPCIADPGYRYVALAHRLGVEVIPYPGPNAIILALMSGGFTGQHFEFHGYLSRDRTELHTQIKRLETAVHKYGKTQIFIETPYRNIQMIKSLSKALSNRISLCICTDLMTADQRIQRLEAKDLAREDWDWIHKKPTVFVMGV